MGLKALLLNSPQEENQIPESLIKPLVKELFRAESIKDMLRLYIKEKPDIVIANFIESEGGIDAIKRIKTLNPSGITITYSDIKDSGLLKEAINAGLDYYLNSPLNEEILKFALEKLSKKVLTFLHIQKENYKLRLAFNSPSHLIAMSDGKTIFSANKPFLEFFSIQNLKNFDNFFASFIFPPSSKLQKEGKWIAQIGSFANRVVKLKGHNGSIREFFPKVDLLTQNKEIYLITFTDVTGLTSSTKETQNRVQKNEQETTMKVVGALDSAKINDIIKKEIYRFERYKSTFCVLRISATIIEGTGRMLEKKSLSGIMERSINFQIRPTDIFEKITDCDFFVLTPHTEIKGSEALIVRLKNDILNDPKLLNYAIDFKFVALSYTGEKESNELIAKLETAHKKAQAVQKRD